MNFMFQTFRNGNAYERDERNKCMANISSYSLKTLVWLLGDEKPHLEWSNKYAPQLFLEVKISQRTYFNLLVETVTFLNFQKKFLS
jgi:hypothetical protein